MQNLSQMTPKERKEFKRALVKQSIIGAWGSVPGWWVKDAKQGAALELIADEIITSGEDEHIDKLTIEAAIRRVVNRLEPVSPLWLPLGGAVEPEACEQILRDRIAMQEGRLKLEGGKLVYTDTQPGREYGGIFSQ